MDIKEEIHELIHLQKIDSRLQEMEDQEKKVELAIQRVRDPLTRLEARKDELVNRISDLRQESVRIERTIQEYGDKIEKSRDKLPLITTQKEYFAFQKEIEIMQKEKSRLEDQLLQQMGELEEQQKERDEASAMCRDEEKEFLAKKEEMEQESRKFHSEREALEAEREKICREIEAAHLRLYNKTLISRGAPAMVEIINGNCQGCHMTLPPQLFNDVRKGESMITCSYCNRILYVES